MHELVLDMKRKKKFVHKSGAKMKYLYQHKMLCLRHCWASCDRCKCNAIIKRVFVFIVKNQRMHEWMNEWYLLSGDTLYEFGINKFIPKLNICSFCTSFVSGHVHFFFSHVPFYDCNNNVKKNVAYCVCN